MEDMPMPMPSEDDMIYNMQMTITTGSNAGWILFKSWEVSTAGGIIGALLFVLALAFISEGMSFLIWTMQ